MYNIFKGVINLSNKIKFDLDYFENNNIAINCETEEEAKELFRLLKEYGVKWSTNAELDVNDTYWGDCREQMCYDIDDGELTFDYYEYYEGISYNIIKFKYIEF